MYYACVTCVSMFIVYSHEKPTHHQCFFVFLLAAWARDVGLSTGVLRTGKAVDVSFVALWGG